MLDERVDRMRNRYIVFQRTDMFHHHVGVERLRVIVIELRALLVGQFGMRLVVVVVAQRGDVVVLERLLQPLDERTLAGTRSAGNADDRNVHDKIVY